MNRQNDLEAFWAGEFGDEYIKRHNADKMIPAKTFMFQKMLAKAPDIDTVIELGTNQGWNLEVLHCLNPGLELHGVEINRKAAQMARRRVGVKQIVERSLLDVPIYECFDLAFTVSVLIHIEPEVLPRAYSRLYNFSRKYVLLCEYHNPTPMTVEYRGHQHRLFKRDFAGEMMDAYPDLTLVDYGFFYSRDNCYGISDSNWFLMKKSTV